MVNTPSVGFEYLFQQYQSFFAIPLQLDLEFHKSICTLPKFGASLACWFARAVGKLLDRRFGNLIIACSQEFEVCICISFRSLKFLTISRILIPKPGSPSWCIRIHKKAEVKKSLTYNPSFQKTF
ncbi:MAG: hypothetical protein DDT28_01079 [Dehalococcoidia bacterium]|nr:hypothetical protein [Chloroflexota bacterium]